MIRSMTGYGGAKGVSGRYELTVEIKSVNNRHLDCAIRLPRMYIAAEDVLRSRVMSRVSRGKADVFVTIDTSRADDVMISVNRPLAQAYMAALTALAKEYGVENRVSAMDLARFPEVLSVQKAETDTQALYADIGGVLELALGAFDEMRRREGMKLSDDISARLDAIERLAGLVQIQSPKSVAEYQARLVAKMTEVLQSTELDDARILTEAAIFADRVAVNEELVRLRSHVEQIRGLLALDEPVGRKLDFIVQELNREANTIGSKGNDVTMAKIVVDLKAEIEKIREQAQNVE